MEMELNLDEIQRRRSLVRGVELRRMSAETLDSTDEAIIDYVKCPGCRQFIQPPCVCCEQGHFMCTPCRAENDACPTCGVTSFPNKANAVFDRILKELYYPCVNAENGCHTFLKYSEISEHQGSCRFEKIPCKFHSEGCDAMLQRQDKPAHEEKCSYGIPCKIYLKANETVKSVCCWRGRKERLYDHISSNHDKLLWAPQSLQSNDTFTWMLALNINMEKTEFIRLEDVGEMFYFRVKNITEGPQMLAVQHIGDDAIAASFMYAVEFKYGSKLIVFRDKVIPFSVEDVFNHTNCCNFHFKFLKCHFLAERVCDCYVRIYRCGKEHAKGRRHLYFLGSAVSEERDGSVSNRESFQGVIENCLESSPNYFNSS